MRTRSGGAAWPWRSLCAAYYDDNAAHYLGDVSLFLRTFAIWGTGAVTVVPIDAFGRPIDPRIIRRIDGQVLASEDQRSIR